MEITMMTYKSLTSIIGDHYSNPTFRHFIKHIRVMNLSMVMGKTCKDNMITILKP